MDDLLSEFLAETVESLNVLDVELVKLEQDPNDPDLLGKIFRIVHTIKGTCGFLGLSRLEKLAHAGENVLGKFRDGEIKVEENAVTLILKCLDQIKFIVGHLSQHQAEPEGGDPELIKELNDFAESGGKPKAAAAAEPKKQGGPSQTELDALEAAWNSTQPLTDISHLKLPEQEPEAAPAAANVPVHKEEPKTAVADPKKAPAAAAPQSIRVTVDLLENLMTTVSELVLTRNQLLQLARTSNNNHFSVPLQRLNHVTSELQESVMKTRMQPIGNAWAKLPRIVRDLSVELGKKIDLVMIGAETELDRQVLELIGDPLTHMVRNSADHGLEDTAGRVAVGKSETGKIILEAYHEGGHIIIKIADDGKGLPIAKIKEKIIKNGLATDAEVATMSDQQIQMYIFKAGFSTAAKVTSVSGRGVGMDVVRTNIEKIGGTIELKSTEGKGTTFTVKIPLTLAIVSALIVESANERFAVPQISVLELVLISEGSENKIEAINDAPVLRLRDRLLPLISLDRLLELRPNDSTESTKDKFVIVSQVGATTFGIIVDRVFDTEEIVVKPVSQALRDIGVFSGNTILGDGSVVMILDPNGIAMQIGAAADVSETTADAATKDLALQSGYRTTLLLFRVKGHPPIAVQLSLIARLEDFEAEKIEVANGAPVIQYRGKLMPLIEFEQGYEYNKSGRQSVIVFSDRDHSMGLMVDEILDIVEDNLKIDYQQTKPGIIGSAVVAGKATEVIDVAHFLTKAFGGWFTANQNLDDTATGQSAIPKILLVDDSVFFRNLLTPILSVAGYDVIPAANGKEAMNVLEQGYQISAVVSDIEMPEMGGFELAKAITTSDRYRHIPVVALSSYTSHKEINKGREAGFVDYIPKHDRDALLETLSQTLSQLPH